MSINRFTTATAIVGALSIAACDLDVPDLNNPGLPELQDNPTPALVNSACTGLVIGNRANVAAENGYVDQLGILGREAYNFDAADPRYVSELIQGELDRSSPFGGNFWGLQYTNIRVGNIVLAGVDKLADADLSATAKTAIRGFTHTIQALDLLTIINTHDTNGAVIDTNKPLGQPLGAIVSKDDTLAEIARLLDAGAQELAQAGAAFTFPLSKGYHNDNAKLTFDTPAGFRRFNRAIRARVAIYQKKYADALAALSESFIDDTSATTPLDLGVFHTFSTGPGDVTNALKNNNIFAHPALATDAMKNGATVDARYTRKVTAAEKPGSSMGHASSLAFTLYASPTSPVPIIRNEELILLKAEALFFTSDTAAATTELNLVRQQSGGLPALAATADAATFTDELLYERRYSLLFEGGHRWIDLRRFGKPLPIDVPVATDDIPKDTANVRYPIPQAECDGRPDEPACMKGSTD